MEYYRNGDVSVDTDFARFGSKSYAINKINTVDVRSRNGSGGCLLASGIALVCIGTLVCTENITFGVCIILLGAFLMFGSHAASKVVTYDLFLRTSSSDVQAYESTDLEEINKLREAVERAMTG